MKIRQGFVSNSSSSSFLIYGVRFDKDEWEKVRDDVRLKFLRENYTPDDINYSTLTKEDKPYVNGIFTKDEEEFDDGDWDLFYEMLSELGFRDTLGIVGMGFMVFDYDVEVITQDQMREYEDRAQKQLAFLNKEFKWYLRGPVADA